MAFALSGVINRSRLTNHADLNLPWVIEVLLDFVSDFAGEAVRGKLVDFFGFYNDANLAASLDGKRFFHAGKRVRDTLKRLQTLDVEIDGFTSSARTSRRNRIGSLYD